MKIKCQPEEFRVEELSDFTLDGGPFAVYLLTKRSLGTPEAVEAIGRRWKLRREQVSFGGMKDRHAHTAQRITIHGGPKRGITQTNLQLAYLGQALRPFMPADIIANRFELVLRDMDESAAHKAIAAVDEVRSHGLPNYFDDQRFGSVGESGEFVANAWCLGEFERALWLAIADPNVHDRAEDKAHKRALREGWGRWSELAGAMKDYEHRRILVRLAERPEDFRGAMALLPAHQRDIYLSAFQSHLWNRMLSRWITQVCDKASAMEVKLEPGTVAFFRSLSPEARAQLAGLSLPLPSSRERPTEEPMQTLYGQTLAELGLTAAQLKVKWPRDVFFKKGSRPALFEATNLSAEPGGDELYEGKKKLALRFDLPRGAYATILLKRIMG